MASGNFISLKLIKSNSTDCKQENGIIHGNCICFQHK